MRTVNVQTELETWYVTPGWVGRYYGKTPMQVHKAIADGRLKAVRIHGKWAGLGRDALILDMRELPIKWPKANGNRRRANGL